MRETLELLRKAVTILEAKEQNIEKEERGTQLSDLDPGDIFANELGKFKVLENTDAGTKVIQMGFWEDGVCFDDDSCDYTESELREKFDNEITLKYEEVFCDALVEHAVELKSVDMQPYGAFNCKVRPITFDEAREYNELIVDKDLPGCWWTCTPWSTRERGWEYSVTVVSSSGDFSIISCYRNFGVRPVCILKSNIFVSKEV